MEKTKSSGVSENERQALLAFLKRSHGEAAEEGEPKKITLKRKTTSTLKVAGASGKKKTVNVEVRKKRTYVKRDVVEDQAVDQAKQAEAEAVAAEEARVKAEAEAKQQLAEKAAAKKAEAEARAAAEAEAKRKAEAEAEEVRRKQAVKLVSQLSRPRRKLPLLDRRKSAQVRAIIARRNLVVVRIKTGWWQRWSL